MIKIAETRQEIEDCFPVMVQLRPHLTPEIFLQQVHKLMEDGYRLVVLRDDNDVRSVAGVRTLENLAFGRLLYVDDLVTDENSQSRGHGTKLFEWLIDFARLNDCRQLHLDSGVQRFGAHRFYLAGGMKIAAHHFSMELEQN
jgi:GNAT superfamily N-acetyltransferase